MATFTRRTVYKNGGASYSREGVKASIYVGPKNFADGVAPPTAEFDCANLTEPGANVKTGVSAEAKAAKQAEREAAKAAKAQEREAKKAERVQAREAAKVEREKAREIAKADREAKRQAAIDAAKSVSAPTPEAVPA